jgi:hypothetical protein
VQIRREKQLSPVADEVLALTAVVRPMLAGVLYGLKLELSGFLQYGGCSRDPADLIDARAVATFVSLAALQHGAWGIL